MAMCMKSRDTNLSESMLSAGDSPVRISVMLESGLDSTATGPPSGTKCSGSFAWYDRKSLLWRTWLVY